jgi:hypothetical protein
MSTFNYARARSTAQRLIARFGQAVTLRRTVDSGTAWDPVQVIQDYAITVAVLTYRKDLVDGSRIRATDKQVFASTEGVTVTPTVGDELIIAGLSHSIEAIAPLSPAGTVVFWELQCRA